MLAGALKSLPMLILLPLCASSTHAQILVDQKSTPNTTFFEVSIQELGPVGQGFTPTFSSVDVVQLFTRDFDGFDGIGNGVGADLFVNIRSGTISGSILGTSATLSLPDQFRGFVRFDFASPVALTPGDTYVIEPRVAAGDNWALGLNDLWPNDPYPQGILYLDGSTYTTVDFWFREGVAVPEPGLPGFALSLLCGGGLTALRAHRSKRTTRR